MSLFIIKQKVACRHRLIKPLWILLFLLVNSPCQAKEKTLLTNADASPPSAGVALDSEGRPLAIPTTGSAMNYHAPPVHTAKKNNSKARIPRHKKKRSNARSRKQALASRIYVANDPACRWLDKRMDKLERDLSHSGNQTGYGFHRDELAIRHQEWRCMKCGAQGPNQRDHHTCQHRR